MTIAEFQALDLWPGDVIEINGYIAFFYSLDAGDNVRCSNRRGYPPSCSFVLRNVNKITRYVPALVLDTPEKLDANQRSSQ